VLVQSCDVDRETCLADTVALIAALAKEELVVLTPA
jgi:hypothetical protein